MSQDVDSLLAGQMDATLPPTKGPAWHGEALVAGRPFTLGSSFPVVPSFPAMGRCGTDPTQLFCLSFFFLFFSFFLFTIKDVL